MLGIKHRESPLRWTSQGHQRCVLGTYEALPTFRSCLHRCGGFRRVLITESVVLSALIKLNSRKAAGLDDIGNWLLREYAEILVQLITSILNASFREQRLPAPWKLADVVPLSK